MNPSEMTDDELRLAIAETIAKEKGWIIDPVIDPREDIDGLMIIAFLTAKDSINAHKGFAPNYPFDIAAAMGLLVEEGLCWIIDSRFEFPEVGIITEESKYLRDYTFKATAKNDTLEGIARAICEACYQALVAKGE